MKIRLAFVLLVLAVVLTPSAALADGFVAAFTEAETEEPAEPVNDSGITPAVEAPPEVPPEEDLPWTARYLAPTILALGVIGLIATIAIYGTRIGSKYEVVD